MIKREQLDEGDIDGVETFRLMSLGLDIGSSTSHLALSRLVFRRQGARLSTRFEVVERSIAYRSPIVLTPYTPDGLIDVTVLGQTVSAFMAEADVPVADIDTGLVVITGEALNKANSRAISMWFSERIGSFTCVSAGAHHEALLAAYGSGAVRRSRRDGSTVVCVDIGGGTTKLAVIRAGVVVGTMAFKVGGRLLSFRDSVVERIEPPAVRILSELGLTTSLGASLPPRVREDLAETMAETIMEFVCGGTLSELASDLQLTDRLLIPPMAEVDAFIFSGGVSEYVYARSHEDYGDLGMPLGLALRSRFEQARLWSRVIEPAECIRATVVGAGEHTVQASGMTSFVSDHSVLPVFGLEVLKATAHAARPGDLQDDLRRTLRARGRDVASYDVAISISLDSVPTYPYLRSVAESILAVAHSGTDTHTLFVLVAQDIASSLGALLKNELGWPGPVVAIDGIDVGELDYLDIGRPASAAGAMPVTVKSLVFPYEKLSEYPIEGASLEGLSI